MDLFDYMASERLKTDAPLASRMRPRTLDEFLGQEHILGPGRLLRRAITADRLSSIILYGPPGSGKTTLAHITANITKCSFLRINATSSGKKEIAECCAKAKDDFALQQKRTIIFIDEIHRFNKLQQDALLPFVEEGIIILIGATTENPYFEVNSALLSRSGIFELKPLSQKDIASLLDRAVSDKERGLGKLDIVLTKEARDFLADAAGGDARTALNALELGALTTEKTDDKIIIDLKTAEECIQKRALNYDKDGDNHYDTISAFIKSMRGSDPDAAVYYLAKMITAGEDPKFIARRIIICAAEDVGNADPHALMAAVAAAKAAEFVGFPEARIILAQAAIYVACAPKSNASYLTIDRAISDVKKKTVKTVPPHLQDSHYPGAKNLNRGEGYKYAHDFPGHYVKQQYLPDELLGTLYYEPTENGTERKISEKLKRLRENGFTKEHL
ncbi:MAG: replication-associated recombination protein A [Firmicutes bacterium]|nr:replication-associated recombination protein A [Bacillota bacterium]